MFFLFPIIARDSMASSSSSAITSPKLPSSIFPPYKFEIFLIALS
jgi:hypothetical protein